METSDYHICLQDFYNGDSQVKEISTVADQRSMRPYLQNTFCSTQGFFIVIAPEL